MGHPSDFTGPDRMKARRGTYDYADEDTPYISDTVDDGVTIGAHRDRHEVAIDIGHEGDDVEVGVLAILHPAKAKKLGEKLIELSEQPQS